MNARSRCTLFGLVVFAFLAAVAPRLALADPVVNMTWSSCTDMVQDAIFHEGGSRGAIVSVSGHSAEHRGYALRFLLRATDGGPLPDAWRFDPGGCQDASRLNLWHDPIVEIVRPTSCYPFHRYMPGVGPVTRVVTYDPVAGELQVDFRVEYQPHGLSPDPTWWYGLLRIFIEHKTSRIGVAADPSTCGGFERSVCLRLVDARWIDLAGGEHAWAIGNGVLTAHTPGVTPGSCDPVVPAVAKTWGTIKAQYR